MGRLIALLAGLACLFGPLASLAQPAPLIIDQNRPDRAPPSQTARPEVATGSGSVTAAPAPFAPFVLKSGRVQGSSLSQDTLQAAWAPFVGKQVTSAELGQIAQAISAVYGRSDIALYTILLPRQAFAGGEVRFVAVEGYVADVQVTAQPGLPQPGLLRAYGRRIIQDKPLRRSTLDRYVDLMRDIPGATVDVQVLKSSDAKPGAVVLAVNAKRKRIETGLSINNRGAAYLGRTQVEASITANSVLREGDLTRLTIAAPHRTRTVPVLRPDACGADRRHRRDPDRQCRPPADPSASSRIRPDRHGRHRRRDGDLSVDPLQHPQPLPDRRRRRGEQRQRPVRPAIQRRTHPDAAPRRAYSRQSAKQAISISGTVSQASTPWARGCRPARPPSRPSPSSAPRPALSAWKTAGQSAERHGAICRQPIAGHGSHFAGRRAVRAGLCRLGGHRPVRLRRLGEVAWRPKVLPAAMAGSELYAFADAGRVSTPYASAPRRRPTYRPSAEVSARPGIPRACSSWKPPRRSPAPLALRRACASPSTSAPSSRYEKARGV